MRRRILSICLVFALSAFATVAPLTPKDIGLMLRSGYSNDAILRELGTRHFAGECNDAAEQTLRKAGANDDLIEALKSGAYVASAEETARAANLTKELTERHAAAAAAEKKFDTLYQNKLTQERTRAAVVTAANVSPASSAGVSIPALLKDNLVRWQNGSLSHFNDASIEKKTLIGLYFGADWCVPCRKFTPQLVDFYNRVAAQHPEFEIIFVSLDRSAFGMETYMHAAKMPWPAIAYDKIHSAEAILKYSGTGIPDLVVVDASGKVVSSSYDGKKRLGPEKVLADLDKILSPTSTASR